MLYGKWLYCWWAGWANALVSLALEDFNRAKARPSSNLK